MVLLFRVAVVVRRARAGWVVGVVRGNERDSFFFLWLCFRSRFCRISSLVFCRVVRGNGSVWLGTAWVGVGYIWIRFVV